MIISYDFKKANSFVVKLYLQPYDQSFGPCCLPSPKGTLVIAMEMTSYTEAVIPCLYFRM